MRTEDARNTLPEVLSEQRADDSLVLDLHILDTLVYFPLHFPELPVVPGVVQIDWAIRFARERFPLAKRFRRMEVVKFKDLIRPRQRLQLHLRYHAEEGRLQFAYRQDHHEYSSGRVYFHDD